MIKGKRHTQEWKDNMSRMMRENHPMKGRKHTIEAREKISKANTGRKQSKETIQKRVESRKGYTHSTETRNKISESNMGKIISKESREKIRRTLMGTVSNKKGKSFEEIYGRKRAHEIRNKISKKLIGVRCSPRTEFKKGSKGFNMKHSEETKKKLSRVVKENYRQHPEIRLKIIEARKKQVMPTKDTKIEIKIQSLLSQLHLEYFTHKYISEITHGYQCDILIPAQDGIQQKTVIECDGCYWHGCPLCNLKPYDKLEYRKELDKNRTEELIKAGFKVIRLWEHDIKEMNTDELREVVIAI